MHITLNILMNLHSIVPHNMYDGMVCKCKTFGIGSHAPASVRPWMWDGGARKWSYTFVIIQQNDWIFRNYVAYFRIECIRPSERARCFHARIHTRKQTAYGSTKMQITESTNNNHNANRMGLDMVAAANVDCIYTIVLCAVSWIPKIMPNEIWPEFVNIKIDSIWFSNKLINRHIENFISGVFVILRLNFCAYFLLWLSGASHSPISIVQCCPYFFIGSVRKIRSHCLCVCRRCVHKFACGRNAFNKRTYATAIYHKNHFQFI